MKQFHGHTFSFLCWHLSYWNRKMEQDISKSLSLSFFYSNVHAYWLFCQLLGEQEHIRPQSWQTWTESHNSAIFNTVIYVSAPLALFLSLLSLSHSLSYFLFSNKSIKPNRANASWQFSGSPLLWASLSVSETRLHRLWGHKLSPQSDGPLRLRVSVVM